MTETSGDALVDALMRVMATWFVHFSPLLDELPYLIDELFPSIDDGINHAVVDSK